MKAWHRAMAGLLLLALFAVGYRAAEGAGLLAILTDGQALRNIVLDLGSLGPLAVIAAMTVAILVSPIPSAPIALAAGAAYGHGWGTLYVLAGAQAGAMAAFGIARFLGHDPLRRWLGSRLSVGLMGSQNALMAAVFVSRLLPFLSFDVVSYAAGLTMLSLWRFAAATLAGIAPSSFVLAHFGSEMASGDARRIAWSVLLLGALTAVPIVVKLVRDRGSSRDQSHPED